MVGSRIALWGLALGLLVANAGVASAELTILVPDVHPGLPLESCDPQCYAWSLAMWLLDAAARRLGITTGQPSIDGGVSYGSQSA